LVSVEIFENIIAYVCFLKELKCYEYWNDGKNKNPSVPIMSVSFTAGPLFQYSCIPIVSEAT